MASAPASNGTGQTAAPNGSAAPPVVGTMVESASQVELASAVEEEELLLVNEEQLEEERRLHEEREREEAAGQPATEAVLDDTRFKQLDQLLDQTSLYSKFLSEQMETMDGVAAAAAAAGGEGEGGAGDDGGVGGKRRASGKGTASKKARGEGGSGTSPTLDLLPLMTGGEMRSYQLKGVQWMISLYQNGLNGILADQMGLGKTVQTIGFLSHLRSKSVLGPYLIIGPLSTLPNWVSEFERWCPSFPVCLYHGNRQERAAMRAERFRPSSGSTVDEHFPAIVTSYEIVMADRKFLARYTFKYIVVDEGHRLKNFDCKLLRELKTIPSANKLLLSGTPLQNSLPELWSLLHFLLPDVFSSLEQFQSWFDFSGIVSSAPDGGDEHAKRIADEEHRNKVVSKLHAILRPFLLRRLKSDVESNLPRKKEILLWAEMAPPQVEFNTALVNRTCDELLRKIATDGGAQSSGVSLNNVLMQLRKNCNHPDLITGGLDGSIHFPSADELVAACGKMRLLERLLTRLRAKGHKVLIFSQMTRMLDLIAHYCDERGLHCCRIDGSVHWQERRDQITAFNDLSNDAFVFLLSTRAGGLGLNLTAADTVIIYDSDWNPHQDMQAMDRVHRIGQTKPVHVYRLATAHSVEGKMLKRASSKLMLERLVITHGNFATESVGGGPAAASAAGPSSKGGAGLSAQELIQLLRGEAAGDDSLPQSGVITDEDLVAVMDRSDLEGVVPKGKAPLPSRGVGFEVVEDKSGKGLLSTVE